MVFERRRKEEDAVSSSRLSCPCVLPWRVTGALMAGARTSLWTRLWLVYGNDKSFPTTRGGLKGGEGEKSEFSLHCSIFFFSGLSFIFNLFLSMKRLFLRSRGLIGCVCQFRVNCKGGTRAATVSDLFFSSFLFFFLLF